MKMSILKICLVLLLVCTGSCATRSAQIPTMESYLEVENGETREELLQKFGAPVSITVEDDGTETYKYIERFSLNGRVVDSKTYYFFLKDGIVVGKIAETVVRPQTINSDQLRP